MPSRYADKPGGEREKRNPSDLVLKGEEGRQCFAQFLIGGKKGVVGIDQKRKKEEGRRKMKITAGNTIKDGKKGRPSHFTCEWGHGAKRGLSQKGREGCEV